VKNQVSTEKHQITVSGIRVEVVRKAIKNMHLTVYPPDGRVRITVPKSVNDEAVRLVIVRRLGWIKRQQAKFESKPCQSQREMVTGESHYFMGHPYLLQITEHTGPGTVLLRSNTHLDVFVRSGATVEQRERVLQEWYREQLRALIPPLIKKWEAIMDVQVAEWRIKRMKTRWGSCNIRAGRIWLSLELATKPLHCLEYVIVHEMAHLRERRHDKRFKALMDELLPCWRLHKAELNAAPLT
jgi:predicted metal-dependent hydrolase